MDTLFASLDLIEPGDLVLYHGSLTDQHGLYIAQPCDCYWCRVGDKRAVKGSPETRDPRYRLINPWRPELTLRCARRESITRSTACA
jgi:hypothetical protein